MAPAPALSSLAELLHQRAAGQPRDPAIIFLSENGEEQQRLDYEDLYRRALALAHRLAAQAGKGDRAIVMLPTGPEFAVALFACFLAGVVAVPVMPPRRLASRDSSEEIFRDCAPNLVLTSRAIAQSARADRLRHDSVAWIFVEEPTVETRGAFAAPREDDLAILQYTSGSTSSPRGVMVSHRNLLANQAAIRQAFGNSVRSTYVSWSPLYHDMGLVMDLLQPIYLGAPSILMRPASFLQRPLNWLRAIHTYRAEVAGAPNFAFDLCVERFRPGLMEGIDLSHWKVAFNGAEPVRAATLARFAETFRPYGFEAAALYPCYGLAEATLMVTGGLRGAGAAIADVSRAGLLRNRAEQSQQSEDAQQMVACGHPVAQTRLAIIDPDTHARLEACSVGEIWACGPGVARGYWNNEIATQAIFRARIAGEEGDWLRTGDLGFLNAAGELTITGRSKDILIVRGLNHYPQDIEDTVRRSHPALARGDGAVFAADEESGRLVVAQEIDRLQSKDVSRRDVVEAVREAVARDHELSVQEVVLLGPATLPKTTSGKVRRALTADMWRQGRLEGLNFSQP